MYVFWPSSVMLVVGWRTTILGIMITASSVVINYLRKAFFNSVGPGPLAGAKLERNVSFINCCYYLRLRLSSLEATGDYTH
jgi:hypothetical protein